MNDITIKSNQANIIGAITLDGSKSISNRVLIIKALSGEDFPIQHLSTSNDTVAMQAALNSTDKVKDIGAAGTTMRFLTAYYAALEGAEVILTGTERMKQRPIGVLVDALRTLGADIQYVESEGCPPLAIKGRRLEGGELSIAANISSQFLSALLMIAPTLKKGLILQLEGELVSRPYLMMTLRIMANFGIEYSFEGNTIQIAPQKYLSKPFKVEADWSAASYYYALAALAKGQVDLQLNGLFEKSLQGDAVLAEMMQQFGIVSTFQGEGVRLSKIAKLPQHFHYNFIECPDIAQTLAVVCAGLKTPATLEGLITLSIKETDRTAALQTELSKFHIDFDGKGDSWKLSIPEGHNFPEGVISVDTYHDHRMAMAFAPLVMRLKGGMMIRDKKVVSKSYPKFWEDFSRLGIRVV